MKKQNGKIRFAVVGLGHIAQVAVLPAFKHAKRNTAVTALVSGITKKATAVAKKYRIKDVYSYERYTDLLSSGQIDAVYIATPNELHTDFACQALEAGIHVLCEKPLAVTADDCLKMISASKTSNAKLMTAYRLHLDKPNLDAMQLCRQNKLGNLKAFVSSFSYVIKDKKNIRLRPIDGSGPLWDIGIYCINAARYLFRENPSEVFAYATRQKEGTFSQVDETVSVVMKFSSNRTAAFSCSFGMTESSYFEVYGDKGMLRLDGAYEYVAPRELHTLIRGKRTKKKYKKVDQFAAELEYFADGITNDRSIEPSGEEGLTDVCIIEAIERSMKTGRSVQVNYAGIRKTSEPKKNLATEKPPVHKPELVDVRAASD